MREKIILFLKTHPRCLAFFWWCAKVCLRAMAPFVRVQEKAVLFSSFGGRNFDDSPRALYDEMCRDPFFAEYRLVWAFTDPDKETVPRGEKVKIDTPAFFRALLACRIWVGNSDITRGISLSDKKHIRIETWHGTPLKCIGGDEKQTSMYTKKKGKPKKPDTRTIRCAQSEFDRDIFARIFSADPSAFLMCDLPRNDALLRYTDEDRAAIRKKLGIPPEKKIILYMPTYREYLINENRELYIAPPITQDKWKEALSPRHVLLVRAHYAVGAALHLPEDGFFYDVSAYPTVSDLYAVADILLSDYSSAFFDFAILGRPMYCYAYDREEYEAKRGLYLNLDETLPCPVDETEDAVLSSLCTADDAAAARTRAFARRFTPHAGHASRAVIDELKKRISA